MSTQLSPDGRWWWDGRQWQPIETLPPPPPSTIYAGAYDSDYGMLEPELVTVPGTIKGAMVLGMIGSGLALLVGALFVVIGLAAGDSSSDLGRGFAEGVSRSNTTLDPSQLATAIAVAGGGLAGVGLVTLLLNVLLLYLMSQQYQWSWFAALALLAVGIVIDLAGLAIAQSGIYLVHILLIQLPMTTLLLLSPSRRWMGIG